MIHNSLFLRINNLTHMTNGEARIVSYFKKARNELAMENILSISEGAVVSKATVTRFIKKLGYQDFAQFKADLRRELFSSLDSPYQRYQAQKSSLDKEERDPWALVVDAAIGDIKEALALNSDEKITETAALLGRKKGRLFVIGQLASFGIAHYFWQSVNLLKPAVLLENLSGNLTTQLVDVNEDDVLFAVSFMHYSQQTAHVMKHFFERGARVVFLTDSEMARPAQWSHIRLLAPTQWETVLISRCACIMVVEGLLSAMFRITDDDVKQRIDEIWRLTNTFNVLYPIEKNDWEPEYEPAVKKSVKRNSGRKA